MTVGAYDSRDWTAVPQSGSIVTISRILFGDDPRAVVPRHGWPALREKLSRVRAEMRPVAERELAAALAGLLDVDLADSVRHAWRSHSRLISAAQATVLNPGTTEVVALATHRITASHTPNVDLVIDELQAATIEVTVEVDIEIDSLVASVHSGRMMSLHSGRMDVCVTMFCGDSELAGGTAVLDAARTVALGPGFYLLSNDEPSSYADRRW